MMKEVAVGILHRDGFVLACQRKRTALYPLQWEFPGGKIETGETPTDALIRELHEELGISAIPGEEFHRQEWNYGDASYRVYYYSVQCFRGRLTNQTFEAIMWMTPEELRNMDILEGNREVVDRLCSRGEIAPLLGPARSGIPKK